MTPLSLFTWGRTPGTDTQSAQWGHYLIFYRKRGSGTWEIALYHRSRRTRYAEWRGDVPEAEVRAEAEGWLLDEQGPEIRELVRRTQAAQTAGAGTRSMRAASAGGKRRHAAKAKVAKPKRPAKRAGRPRASRLAALVRDVNRLTR